MATKTLVDLIQNKKEYNPQQSISWFKTNITNAMKGTGSLRLIGSLPGLQTQTIVPGSMVMFGYNAKLRDTLPFWDKFPLVIITSADKTHFHGFNLHYMPFKLRVDFLNAMYGAGIGKTQQVVASGAVNKAMQWSIKQYIFGRVMTRFVLVPETEWPIACFLPVANFTGATEQQVWREGKL